MALIFGASSRLTIQQQRSLQLGLIAVLLIISFVVYKIGTAGTGANAPALDYYYSADGGQTYYVSRDNLYPPFQKDGKDVVSASLFVGQDKQPFVGFVLKYTPEGMTMLSGFKKDTADVRAQAAQYALVKRPGDKEWVPALSGSGRAIMEHVRDPKTGQPATPYAP